MHSTTRITFWHNRTCSTRINSALFTSSSTANRSHSLPLYGAGGKLATCSWRLMHIDVDDGADDDDDANRSTTMPTIQCKHVFVYALQMRGSCLIFSLSLSIDDCCRHGCVSPPHPMLPFRFAHFSTHFKQPLKASATAHMRRGRCGRMGMGFAATRLQVLCGASYSLRSTFSYIRRGIIF